MFRAHRSRWATLAALTVAMAATACAVETVSTQSAQPEPSPTSEARPRPTPTPAPIDVVAAYEDWVSDPSFTGRVELSGTLVAGEYEGTVSGFVEFDGDDFHARQVTRIGDEERVDEIIGFETQVFEREDDGPWILAADPATEVDLNGEGEAEGSGRWPIQRILREAQLRDAGRTARDGVSLHRLVLERPLPPAALEGPDSAETQLEVHVKPSGEPVRVVVTKTWDEPTSDGSVEAHLETEFTFAITGSVDIRPPDDPWIRYASARLPYGAARPISWEFMRSDDGMDVLTFAAGELQVVFYPTAGELGMEYWFTDARARLEQGLGGIDSEEPITVAGHEARLFSREYVHPGGTSLTVRQVTFLDGTSGWDVNIFSLPEAAPAALEQLMTFLELFEPMDEVAGSEPAATSASPGNVWGLSPGDCFRAFFLIAAQGEESIFVGGVDGFEAVSCDEEHSGEVIALLLAADDDCAPAFEAYVGEPLAGSGLALLHFLPVAADNAPPDLHGLCAVVDPRGGSGSVRAAP